MLCSVHGLLHGQAGKTLNGLQKAQSLYDSKSYDSSLLILKGYLEVVKNNEDWTEVFSVQSLMAQNHSRLRNYPDRLRLADAALYTAKNHLIGSDSIFARALKAKGDALIRTQSYDSSVHYLKKAESLYLKNNNWNKLASCRVGIGSNLFRQRQFANADSILSSTRSLIEEKITPLPSIYGTVLNLLSAIYNTTGDYEKGLENATKSVRFRESLSSQGARLIFAYNNLGMAHFSRADYNKAQEVLERAELTAAADIRANASPLVTIYNNLMLTHLRKKDYDTALEYAFKRLSLTQEASTKVKTSDQVIFYNNLALIYLDTDRLAEAKVYLDNAVALKANDYQTLANLGYYYYRSKDYELSKDYIKQAVDISERPDNPKLAKLYRYQANIAWWQGDTELAEQLFQTSIKLVVPGFEAGASSPLLLKGIRSKRELLKILANKARYLSTNNETLAMIKQTLNTAVALVDSMYYDHKAEGSRVFLKSEALPVYELAIKTLFKASGLEESQEDLSYLFTLFEKGKSSLLSDLVQIKSANKMAGVPKALIEQEHRLRIDIAFYESELHIARTSGKSAKADLYDRYRLEKINELDQLIENFKDQYPRYYRARHAPQRLDLAAVQEKLGQTKELLIEYFVGNESVYVMAISADKVILSEIENSDVLKKRVQEFVLSTNNPKLVQENQLLAFDLQKTLGFSLYGDLLAPTLNRLNDHTGSLHIVADGFLNALPFEALLTQKHEGNNYFTDLPYLIKKYPVRYSYSASIPPESSSKILGTPSVLAMAPFSGKDLPKTENEINQSDLYFKTALYAGEKGTEGQFETTANGHQILHLATHGTINGELPELSYLSFSEGSSSDSTDGRLHVYELENMKLDAELAILSACETGTGSFVSGEGVMSLARGFTYAGVPSVLMSLWKVDDLSGSELIKYFYEGLSSESDKAIALQQAKIKYLEGSDQLHAHPYFWSQFVLVGESTPIQSTSRLPIWFTAIALVLLAGLGVFRWRKSRN